MYSVHPLRLLTAGAKNTAYLATQMIAAVVRNLYQKWIA